MMDEMDTHGLETGMRVVPDTCETPYAGEIIFLTNGVATVQWDDGRTSDCSVDELIPEDGW